jgi:hypothetical protein
MSGARSGMGAVREIVLKPSWSILAVVGLVVAVTACASNTEFKENMLSASGFKATPPKAPAQVASFKSLPPHKLTRVVHKGKTVWVYPDPTVCKCLYIGDQNAHDAYVKKAAQKTTTDMNEWNGPDNPTNMDFSPWVE